jgi:hypothetical protein
MKQRCIWKLKLLGGLVCSGGQSASSSATKIKAQAHSRKTSLLNFLVEAIHLSCECETFAAHPDNLVSSMKLKTFHDSEQRATKCKNLPSGSESSFFSCKKNITKTSLKQQRNKNFPSSAEGKYVQLSLSLSLSLRFYGCGVCCVL